MSMPGLQMWREKLQRRYLEDKGFGSGRQFTDALVTGLEAGDVILDAGCGEGKLRQLLAPGVVYVGLDRYSGKQNNEYSDWEMRPTVMGDIHCLPLATGACKTVALMHVLEHAYEPLRVFKELSRVLQPGGRLFVDVPFMHEIHHAPYDFYRYTPYALETIARGAGLEVVEIRPSGGYFRALSHMMERAPSVISGSTAGGFLVRAFFGYPLALLGLLIKKLQYFLDLQDSVQTMTCGYHCVFRKPEHERC